MTSIILALALLPTVNALIAPQSINALSPGLGQERPVSVRFDRMGISEHDIESSDSDSTGDGLLPSQPLVPSLDNDAGKAIFLATAKKEAKLLDEVNENDVIEPTLGPTEGIQLDSPMGENVSAILAASEEAASAAEATLSAAAASDETTSPEPTISAVTAPPDDRIEVATNQESIDVFVDAGEEGLVTLNEVVPKREVPAKIEEAPELVEAPSVRKILKFAVPAVGVWLCSPLLSLIDTSAVGVLSGTVQQAALNPAVAVTDYAALLIAFMYTGTTNLIAAAWGKDKGSKASPETTKKLVGALQLSVYVGAGLGAVLFVFARQLLRGIIGNDGISPAVFSAAMKYVRIRALGMPAAAMIGSAQAACLGMQDIRSPLYVLAAAAGVNFLGDMLFVGSSHPLIGGAAGAAWATVFSQYAAIAIFIRWLCSMKANDEPEEKSVNLSGAILELMSKPSDKNAKRRQSFVDATKPPKAAEPKKDKGFSVRGFLKGKIRKRSLFGLPSKEAVDEFAPYVVPVTSTQVGRVSGYVAMSHVVSSSLGTVSMAAQQVIVSLFYCLCPIADSLSLTAQSFLPSIADRKPSLARTKALRKAIVNFSKAGGIFGALMMAAVGCIPLLSGFFTTDPGVTSLVNMVVPLLFGIFSVHGLVCSSEGLLLGQKDLGFLGKMYAGFFAVVPYFMLRVKRAALTSSLPSRINLTNVWSVFLSYQLVRFGAWGLRVMQLQRRNERQLLEQP